MQNYNYKLIIGALGVIFCIIAALGAAAKMTGFSLSKRLNYKTNVVQAAYTEQVEPSVPSVSETVKRQKNQASLLDRVSPEVIDFYEQNIAKQKVVSDIGSAKLEKMAKTFGFSTGKYSAVLILKDLAARCGDELDIKDIAALSDLEIILKGKAYVEKYADSLGDEEKSELKEKFKKLDISKMFAAR
jgi:hypothetical protein